MDSVTTILKYGQDKNCMLVLVDSFQGNKSRTSRDDGGIIVYEADLASGLKAYFSVQGKSVELSSGDTVQLHSWYANKLGLKDEEPLPLRRIKSTVAKAKSVLVEPLSADDWEIVEKNAGRVETVLLDQVRVVWKGQILPVWIQRSTCIYLKICDIDPAVSCVILEKNTEVIIASKVRSRAPPSSLPLRSSVQYQSMSSPRQNQTDELSNSSEYDNIDILEPRPSIHSPNKSPRSSLRKSFTRPTSGISRSNTFLPQTLVQRQSSLMESVMRYIFPTVFTGEKKEVTDNMSDSDKGSFMDYSMTNLPSRNGVLRVQPMIMSCKLEECFAINKSELNKQILTTSVFGFRRYNKKVVMKENSEKLRNYSFPLEVFQPSTVYVDAECTTNERLIHPYLPYLPNNFIARLQKLASPQEKSLAAQKKRTRSGNTGSTAEPSQAETTENVEGVPANSKTSEQAPDTLSCYVRVVVIDRKAGLTDNVWQKAADQVLSNQPLLYGHVIIPELLRRQLRLENTGAVWIQTGTIDLVIPLKIHIYLLSQLPRTVGNDIVILAFRNYIKQCADEQHPLVVFQGIFLKFVIFPELHAEVQLTFFGENDPGNVKVVTMLSELNIDNVQIVIQRDLTEDKLGVINALLPYSQTNDFDELPLLQKLKQLGGVDCLVQQALLCLHASLASRPLSRHTFQVRGGLSHGILLITGPRGSGKSSLVKGLCRKMAHLPVLAYVTVVDCKSLRGKPVSTIQKTLEMMFVDAAWREPAVVVLENLDIIVPAPSGPETEVTGEALYSAKNAQVLESLIRCEIQNNSRVTVIATSISRSSLHPSLTSSRGMHCIQQTINIGSPEKDSREKILMSILQKHSNITLETVKTLDLSSIAMRTEGYVARDIELLVNRTLHSKMSKDKDGLVSQFTLSFDDFEETLSTFKPVSVRNVPLHKAGDLGWTDVGGLASVKNTLIETLRWPTKYPQLFSSCPLRLRSGILLYGAPGTGKTLLAGIVAKECGLNFISVKGPELLNKYIGASEQAVRDLFTKAQSAKPCILFFDEFDSIAPKRGHDSTGVTDRVVNQLLTQLDGVEGLQGVYVLAATSRPDLIDPALLRPGRLDICLYCAMPDENDRRDILSVLTHKMILSTDVNLSAVAAYCEHFTGADLKALLYNAQLKVIHEHTDGDQSMNESVLWIKGDANQSGTTMRRASVVKNDIGSIWLSLSNSVSVSSLGDKSSVPGDLQSPRQISRSSENSPHQTSSSSGKRTPKSIHLSLGGSEVSDIDLHGDGRRGKGDYNTGNIFQYPDLDEKGAGDKAQWTSQNTQPFDETDGEQCHFDIGSDSACLPSPTSSISNGSSEASQPTQIKTPPPHSAEALSKKICVPRLQTSTSLSDSVEVLKDLPEKEQAKMATENVERNLTSTHITEISFAHTAVSQDSRIPYKDSVVIDTDLDNDNDSSAASESVDSQQNQTPVITNPPSSYRKRRVVERMRKRGYPKGLVFNKDGKTLDSQTSSTLDRPITVFTSLKSGPARLSVEAEDKYLAMIREIQHRDETFFQEANSKRRTSLQLESRISVLMEVCHHHLMKAAKSMRPSVSAAERARYMKIYEHFVASRKSGYDKVQETATEKRATLA